MEQKSAGGPATADDVRHYLGDIDNSRLMQVMALQPTIEQLEEAASWLAGEGDRMSRTGHPLAAQVAAIFDILSEENEEDPLRPA